MGFGRKRNLAVWDVSGMFRYIFGERANCKLEWWTLKIFLPHMDPEPPNTCSAAETGGRVDPSLTHDREQSQSN